MYTYTYKHIGVEENEFCHFYCTVINMYLSYYRMICGGMQQYIFLTEQAHGIEKCGEAIHDKRESDMDPSVSKDFIVNDFKND